MDEFELNFDFFHWDTNPWKDIQDLTPVHLVGDGQERLGGPARKRLLRQVFALASVRCQSLFAQYYFV